MSSKKSKLLVCVNHSDTSITALKYAAKKAKKNNHIIEILTVINLNNSDFGLFSVSKIIHTEKQKDSKDYMNNLSKKVKEWSGQKPVINIREGLIHDEISNVVKKDESIDLIIVGSSPESVSKGRTVSDITEQIYNKTFVPIIIIPNNLSDEHIDKII